MAACAVKTSQWGRKHGHLALIVNEAKYRLITATTNSVYIQVKLASTDPNIDGKTSNSERIKLSRVQDEKIREFNLQEETDEQLKEKINEAKYRLITATTIKSVDRQVKTAGTDPEIDEKKVTSNASNYR